MDLPTIPEPLTDQELKLFSAIKRFANDLVESFDDQHSIVLYNHLICKTKPVHVAAVRKHISAFSQFCKANESAILKVAKGEFPNPSKIEYSANAYIDMFDVLNRAVDKETLNSVFKHLLFLLAIVDPASNAKATLVELQKADSDNSFGESNNIPAGFSKIVDKIKTHINPDDLSNPMKAVQSLMSKNVFADILKTVNDSIKDGSLDLGEMASQMNLNQNGGDDISAMMNPVMSMMNNSGGDISSMMAMLNPNNPLMRNLSSGMFSASNDESGQSQFGPVGHSI
jgi:hypothetical protein